MIIFLNSSSISLKLLSCADFESFLKFFELSFKDFSENFFNLSISLSLIELTDLVTRSKVFLSGFLVYLPFYYCTFKQIIKIRIFGCI